MWHVRWVASGRMPQGSDWGAESKVHTDILIVRSIDQPIKFKQNQNTGKRDVAGMPIYCPEDMRVGKGGDTALCPFDCNCCF